MITPILLLEGFFLFPKCENNLSLAKHPYCKEIVLQSLRKYQGYIFLVSNQGKIPEQETEKTLFNGVLVKIGSEIPLEILETKEKQLEEIKLKGLSRANLTNLKKEESFWVGNCEIIPEEKIEAIKLRELTEKFARYLPEILDNVYPDSSVDSGSYVTMINFGNLEQVVDFIFQNSREISDYNKQKALAECSLSNRLEMLINLPRQKKIDDEINEVTKKKIKQEQIEYWLNKKKEAIEKRLKESRGYGSEEMRKYLRKVDEGSYPENIKEIILREIEQYESTPNNSVEASMIHTYIDWLVSLPWAQKTEEIIDLKAAQEELDKEHYGLTKVKERIIEFLAARKKSSQTLGQIICLIGPPGVGKTSLARSIASATGRKFISISVGGASDEAFARGHRRTYIGSMPGRILQSMRKVQVINPLMLIDEIDKIPPLRTHRGDVAYALLEILDVNQNSKFVDNYLGPDASYDLSQVLFICTANSYKNIPQPLLDRLEIIELSGYTEEEKVHIAQKHLIPKNLKRYDLKDEIEIKKEAILEIIRYYTREAGVRELDRKIEAIFRKFIVQLIKGEKNIVSITRNNVRDYLKEREIEPSFRPKEMKSGAFCGLAYTSYGGDILPIEVVCYLRSREDPELTGNIDPIMKESCSVALNYVRANCQKFGISPDFFSQYLIHIHLPEAGIPKEGCSAGIALVTAIISAITGRVVSRDFCATGEITLHGWALAIGGLKEKSSAAVRSGFKTMIIPKDNEKDIDNLPKEIRQKIEIVTVERYDEVWEILFNKKKQENLDEKK